MNISISPYGVFKCESYGFTPEGKYMHTLIKSCTFREMLINIVNADKIEPDEHKEYSVLRGVTEYDAGISLSFRKAE